MSSGGGWWVSAQLALMGGGGKGGGWLVLVRSLSPALGHKVLFAHASSSWSGWVDPGILLLLPTGPRSSWLIAVYFLPSFLVAVIGKGQLQNRHPKAKQAIRHSMGKCAVRRTPLRLCLWFYIIQGFTNAL